MNEETQDFQSVRLRLDEIADAVSDEALPLDDALSLYEEAIKLGMLTCDLSETSPESEEEAEASVEDEGLQPDSASPEVYPQEGMEGAETRQDNSEASIEEAASQVLPD